MSVTPLQAVLMLDEEWFSERPFTDRFHRPLTTPELECQKLPDDGTWWQLVVRTDTKEYAHFTYRKAGESNG